MDVYEALIDLSQQHKLSLTEEHRIECYKTIEEALKNYERRLKLAKEYEDVNKVGKRLKALEIIKDTGIVVQFIKETNSVEQYNAVISGLLLKPLTKQEYDLLKEVFYD